MAFPNEKAVISVFDCVFVSAVVYVCVQAKREGSDNKEKDMISL